MERRRTPRGGPETPHRGQLVSRVLGSFREMPGLKLTPEQASRLIGVSDLTCRVVLENLVASGDLRRLPPGLYALPEV